MNHADWRERERKREREGHVTKFSEKKRRSGSTKIRTMHVGRVQRNSLIKNIFGRKHIHLSLRPALSRAFESRVMFDPYKFSCKIQGPLTTATE